MILQLNAILFPGNLYFANVQKADGKGERENKYYTCESFLPEYKMYLEGAPVYIEVQPGKTLILSLKFL